jgi:hypothetical protein
MLEVGGLRIPVKLRSSTPASADSGRADAAGRSAGSQRGAARSRADFGSVDARLAAQAAAGVHVFLPEGEGVDRLSTAAARTIRVTAAVPAHLLDARWFQRVYALEVDSDENEGALLSSTLEQAGLYGIAEWSMRGRVHRGCLRADGGALSLATLQLHAERAILRASRRLRERLIRGAPARRVRELVTAGRT